MAAAGGRVADSPVGGHNAPMAPDEANPFQRGTGSYPPVLAGRRAELSALRRLLSGLANGTLEQTIHLLQAPRGLGKTVLLQALERDASVRVDAVDVLRTSAGASPSLDDIAQLIEPARQSRRLLDCFSGASALGIRIQRPTDAETAPRRLGRALERRSSEPLLLAIDEAHMLAPDICRVLLSAFQDASGRSLSALLLVGTPALTTLVLSPEVGASFAERAPMIEPGLLSREESLDALHVPQWQRWTVDESVLHEVAADSLGYPFFLQLWGEQLWEAGLDRRTVDAHTLEAAREGVQAVRSRFYAARFNEFERFALENEIDRHAVMEALQRVASQVSDHGAVLPTGRLTDAVENAGLNPAQAASAMRFFVESGFLTPMGDGWRAAIPSLATYICNHPR